MKNRILTYLLCSVSLLSLLSCGEDTSLSGGTPSVGDDRVSVEFTFSDTATRAGETLDDALVRSVDALVFRRSTGVIEAAARVSSPTATLTIPRNTELDCYFFTNLDASVLSSVTSVGQLASLRASLADNESALLMEGHVSRSFTLPTTVHVSLVRLCSKVTVKMATVDFYHDALSVTLRRAYLINAIGDSSLLPSSGEPLASSWIHKGTYDLSLLSPLTYRELDIPVTSSESILLDLSLYTYPNPTDNGHTHDSHPLWDERNSRLVLEVEVNGVTYYYPVTLPSMSSGVEYLVSNALLLGLGRTHPDTVAEPRMMVGMAVAVEPWTDEPDKEIELQ